MKRFSRDSNFNVLNTAYLFIGIIALVLYAIWNSDTSKLCNFLGTLGSFSLGAFFVNFGIVYLLKGSNAFHKDEAHELIKLKKAIYLADEVLGVSGQLRDIKGGQLQRTSAKIESGESGEFVKQLLTDRFNDEAETLGIVYAKEKPNYVAAMKSPLCADEAALIGVAARDGFEYLKLETSKK